MKQLNFRHFDTKSEKLNVAVTFFQKETKTAPKGPILFCIVHQGVFGHFWTISDYFRRFSKTSKDCGRRLEIFEDSHRSQKTTEDVRRLPKISEEK